MFCRKKLLKEATIHFYYLFDESRFSDICTIMELKELNWLRKKSEAANLVFQWIFVLNSVKHKFFHVSIVKAFFILFLEILSGRIMNCFILFSSHVFPKKTTFRKSPKFSVCYETVTQHKSLLPRRHRT